jgi:diadenosine tetraphosphate (Ap4A) HIT family hydrolase
VRYDRYPVSEGHVLVVPFRHVPDFFDLNREEQSALLGLLTRARVSLPFNRPPDGFNVGINVGTAAGQTVMHAHVHLIPRYAGDVPDPRGGVRFVIPQKAKYWQGMPSNSPNPK